VEPPSLYQRDKRGHLVLYAISAITKKALKACRTASASYRTK